MKILLSLIEFIKDDQQKYQTLSITMKKKMNIRCPSSITNSRSCTQDLKINSAKQWVDILDGIDAIAHKVKEISAHDLSACLHAGRGCKQHCQVSKSTTRVNTTFDCSRSASKKRNEKYCIKNSKIEKKQRQCCTRNASSKIIKRPCNCQSRSRMKKQQIDYCCQSNVSQKRVIVEPACQTRCHEVMNEMSELKRINDELIRKNEELSKKLNASKDESKYSSKQKIQRQKANEIILRVIHQKQSNHSYESQQNQSISVQLKPNNRSQYKSEIPSDYMSSQTKLKKTLAKPQNIAIRIDANSKKQKQEKQKTSNLRVLDISTQKYCPQANHNQSMMASQTSQNLRKSRPSELKSLETEFDRLMEISYLERNKARKRIIWGQMKSIANQLKLMRNFTQN